MTDCFTHKFSYNEAKDLVLFLRKYESDLPEGLESFMNSLESFFYNTMTIEEAEEFFHAENFEN